MSKALEDYQAAYKHYVDLKKNVNVTNSQLVAYIDVLVKGLNHVPALVDRIKALEAENAKYKELERYLQV